MAQLVMFEKIASVAMGSGCAGGGEGLKQSLAASVDGRYRPAWLESRRQRG